LNEYRDENVLVTHWSSINKKGGKNMLKNKMKNQSGITLVALVITVILLLILAGVTMSQITGEGGLFARANYAGYAYNAAAYNESDDVKDLNGLMAKYIEGYVEPFNYTVIFDKNGGTGTMANQQMVYGTSSNLTANSFTKTGAVFTGWSTTADGSGAWYTDGQNVKKFSKCRRK